MTTEPKTGISEEMRDFTEKSVDQARAAVDNFINTARRNAEIVRVSAEALSSSAQTVSAQGFDCASQNINAAFDFAKRLVRAKNAQEASEIQNQYIRVQFSEMQRQAKDLGSAANNAFDQVEIEE